MKIYFEPNCALIFYSAPWFAPVNLFVVNLKTLTSHSHTRTSLLTCPVQHHNDRNHLQQQHFDVDDDAHQNTSSLSTSSVLYARSQSSLFLLVPGPPELLLGLVRGGASVAGNFCYRQGSSRAAMITRKKML